MKKIYYAGFTMIELLIAVVIIAILVRITVPSYKTYILKSRRTDGTSTILTLSLSEERYRSTNASYGTLAQIGAGAASPQGYYNLSISNVGATTYTITATAQGGQTSDAEGGTTCSPLQMAVNSGTITKTPAACWPT